MTEPAPDRAKRFKELHAALEETGFDCEVIAAEEDDMSVSTIVFPVPPREGETERFMSMTVLPDDGALEQADLIQAWVYQGKSDPALLAHLAYANAEAPVGHSAVRGEDVHHRHVLPVQVGSVLSGVMVDEWVSLVLFSADLVMSKVLDAS